MNFIIPVTKMIELNAIYEMCIYERAFSHSHLLLDLEMFWFVSLLNRVAYIV